MAGTEYTLPRAEFDKPVKLLIVAAPFYRDIADNLIAGAKAEIEATLNDAARHSAFLRNNMPEVIYNGFEAEGYALAEDDSAAAAQAISALETAHRRVTGVDLGKLPITATTDARFFGLYADTPALVYGPRAEAIHGFNERVELESMRRVTQATALFIADWCGVQTL